LRSNGEGEVGIGDRSGIPHLTPALSAPRGGEGKLGQNKNKPWLPATAPKIVTRLSVSNTQ